MNSPSGPAYRVHTHRLVLRCWNPADAPLAKRAVDESRAHLRPWMPWAHGEPEPLSAYVQRLRRYRGQFDLGQDFVYGLFAPDERRVLGGSGLHTWLGEGAREIGYWIHHAHLNQGLATEAAAALVKVGFEIERVGRLEIHCNPDNVRSAAVPQKLGFTLEAVLKQRMPFLDEPKRDLMLWTLLADDYPASPAAHAAIEAFDAAGERLL